MRRFSDYSGVKHAIRTEYGELLMICMTAINPFLTFLFQPPMKGFLNDGKKSILL